MAFLGRRPAVWQATSRMIADRLEWANRRRLDFGGYPVPVRLARVMLELSDRHGIRTHDGYELGVQLSQPELGRLVGARKDAVEKAMRVLHRKGLVRTRYRHVTMRTPGCASPARTSISWISGRVRRPSHRRRIARRPSSTSSSGRYASPVRYSASRIA